MTVTMSQNEALLALLRTRGDRGVTPREALALVGSFRLAARINDLRDRNRGYLRDDEEIETQRVTVGDATFARYVLRPRRTVDGVVSMPTLW